MHIDLPDELVSQIIMLTIPTYAYLSELRKVFEWAMFEPEFMTVFDCIRLLAPLERDMFTFRYCHFQRIYDEEL